MFFHYHGLIEEYPFGIFEKMQKVKPMCLKNEIQHDIDDIFSRFPNVWMDED